MAKINPRIGQSTKGAKPQAAAGHPLFLVGLVLLLVAVAASLMLVLQHLAGMALPGCGIGSGCERAAASVWGKVPGLNIPTSSIGLAYFTAIAIGWIVSRGEPTSSFRWLVRFGALVSAGLLAVIAIEKYICMYCLAAHAGNLAFWLLMEMTWANTTTVRATRAFATACVAFVVVGIALGGIELANKNAIAAREKKEHQESVVKIIERSTQPVATAPAAKPFTGRYRLGPENAPIRVVIVSDYQCHDCKGLEQQVKTLLATRTDISVSAKHFPMCKDCNEFMGQQNMHPNACWAARAAETAGIMRADQGFWAMHHWLFDHNGRFDNQQDLAAGLTQLGYSPEEQKRFVQILQSDQSVAPVKLDIDEAHDELGLHFTPQVFINGEELRGVRTPNSLIDAVNSLAATNPKPGTAAQDHPSTPLEKHVADWFAQRPLNIPADTQKWPLGPDNAPVKIVMFSDYQFGLVAELDGLIRALMKDRTDIQYTFRHFPIDTTCNSEAEKTVFTRDCWAARAAEAAGILGGSQAFWKVHDWLLKNTSQLTDDALRQAAPGLGLDAQALFSAMNSPQVQSAIMEDASAYKVVMNLNLYQGIPQGVPALYINNKWVPRWQLGTEPVVQRIIDEAAKK